MTSQPRSEQPGADEGLAEQQGTGESRASRLRTLDELLAALEPVLGGGTLSADQCLEGIEAVQTLIGQLEAARLTAVGELAARTGEELLRRQGVHDPEELSPSARERWRARSKSVTAAEVATLTGLGRGRSRSLVGMSLAPRPVFSAIRQGLTAGVVSGGQVEQFWRGAGGLPHEQAAEVALSLMATQVEPGEAAEERLDDHGDLAVRPWAAAQFANALQREITRVRSTDPQDLARERERAHRQRTAYGIVDDDGSGQVVITGDAASTAAALDRLHILARRARAAGDERSESALRSDIARALLIHGTLSLGDHGDTGSTAEATDAALGVITPDDLEALAKVISGTPTYELQVIVPWDAVCGAPLVDLGLVGDRPGGVPGGSGDLIVSGGRADGGHPDGEPAGGCSAPAGVAEVAEPTGGCSAPAGVAEVGDGKSPRVGLDVGPVGVRPGVGRVVGRFTRFLAAGELAQMATSHGTTLTRLLVDPADGRCLERSIARYQPDAMMRAQLRAADVLSRAPGGSLPVRDGQLDHVQEYLLGGPTAETNLQGLDLPTHFLKTQGFWQAAMDASRNVTWTSLFGRVYRTRTHDYRQYLPERASAWVRSAGESGAVAASADERYLASLLVYAALVHRDAGARLEAPDDDPVSDEHLLDHSTRLLWVRHTRTKDGRRVAGPRDGTPTVEELLDERTSAVLRSDHWTDPFTARRVSGRGGQRATAADYRDQPPPF